MTLPFNTSQPLTLGVELELQLVNRRNYNLATDAADLLRRMAEIPHTGEIKPEITQSMVELNSSIHTRVDELRVELRHTRDAVANEARRMNVGVAGGGAHPFQTWSERRIFPSERFQELSETYGYLAKQFTVFGQHIHIGCENGDDALYLSHALARYVPHFIALSASSPFYQGVDTAFDSSRLSIVNAFPLSGTVPFVQTWQDFERYYARMLDLGVIRSMKDFYWDIRPKPEFGTVEIRVCDTPLTVDRAVDIAGYAQTVARYLLRERAVTISPDLYLVYNYNRFQACRSGLNGNFINPLTHTHGSIGEDLARTAEMLQADGAALATDEILTRLAAAARAGENDAQWLRDTFARVRSLNDMVRLQSDKWLG